MMLPHTSRTLLHRLKSSGEERAWQQFVEIYTPLLHQHVRARGISPHDGCDVVQEIMRRLFLAMPRFDYQPERARFRTWLYRVVENQINQYFRSRQRRPQGDGRTTLMHVAEQVLAHHQAEIDERRWEMDYRRRLFEWATVRVKPEFTPRIWEAFWRTAVRGERAETVGLSLGMTRAAVYMSRNRCVRRIREQIDGAGGYEMDIPETEGLCLTEV